GHDVGGAIGIVADRHGGRRVLLHAAQLLLGADVSGLHALPATGGTGDAARTGRASAAHGLLADSDLFAHGTGKIGAIFGPRAQRRRACRQQAALRKVEIARPENALTEQGLAALTRARALRVVRAGGVIVRGGE